MAVGFDHLREARIGCGELRIMVLAARRLPGKQVEGEGSRGPGVEVIRTAEIVFGAGSIDGGELAVAVEKELDLALPPPTVVVDPPGKIGAHVLPPTLHAI